MEKLKDILKKAQKGHYGVGQFNFSTLEQLKGILAAAKKLKKPVILGTSQGESRFLGLKEILALVEIAKLDFQVPVFLNLDHGKDLNWLKKAIDYGYSAVHFDGSDLPLEKNIRYTKKIAEYAHKRGVLVEGEMGYISGKSSCCGGRIKIREKDLTNSEQAGEFVKKTGVDSLAIAIGNVHGIYSGMPKLDFKRLGEIRKKTRAFLVLHGGSGIPPAEIKKSVKAGIVKININTELRMVWKNSLGKALKSRKIKPYNILPEVEKAVQKKVEEKIKLFSK